MTVVKLVTPPEPTYKNIVQALRNIADDIESGKFGEVSQGALAIFGSRLEVFGFGANSDIPNIHFLLGAAQLRITKSMEEYR